MKKSGVIPFVSILAMAAAVASTVPVPAASAAPAIPTASAASTKPEPSAAPAKPAAASKPNASKQQASPQRVAAESVPARIAFTNQNHLWVMDAKAKGAAPKQVTTQGTVEIVGWSYNGEWLMYKQYKTEDRYSSDPVLWVVRADGTGAYPIETMPVYQTAKWSPTELQLAYATNNPKGHNQTQLTIATISAGKVTAKSRIDQVNAGDFTWMPDGKALLVATPATVGVPPRLVKMDLAGNVAKSFGIGEKPTANDGIYMRQAAGMAVSPDGRYVAYYQLPNSSSLAADGVSLMLLDLQQPAKRIELGGSLAYNQWLTWSADSSRLAFVEGGGREATTGKHLMIAERRTGFRPTQAAEEKLLSLQPEWGNAAGSTLYFEQGKENLSWMGNYDSTRVLVPGQRIWQRTADGKAHAVTTGPANTADYAPIVSPDGKTMLFLRLDSAEHGSLYMKSGASQEGELLRNVTGENGYYGNYLPGWVAVHWTK
ncbi:UNVERIFIED_CONTAM: Tol biopolymer transport system component [Brevibacillus sp. OAP136]